VATASVGGFETPLGVVPLDRATLEDLVAEGLISVRDDAHREEHSLEVHLPFLQIVLGSFVLLPLLVGRADQTEVSNLLERVWGGDETLIVVSTDLSHFRSYDEAKALDHETSRLIENLDGGALNGERACGYQPVRGLLHALERHHLSVQAVDVRNSGDTAGPRREVVGYGAYVSR
jgi:AmmeMemoRadiSam system protein B